MNVYEKRKTHKERLLDLLSDGAACPHPRKEGAAMCGPCYYAMRRPRPVEERFWAKVNKDGPIPAHRPDLGPCWLWTAFTNKDGYGQFWDGKRLIQAHRWPYEQKHELIGDGLVPDHLCRIPACVRDEHIEIVTQLENCRRGIKGVLTTHCPQGHPYNEANTLYHKRKSRAVSRECRVCQRRRQCEARQRKGDDAYEYRMVKQGQREMAL